MTRTRTTFEQWKEKLRTTDTAAGTSFTKLNKTLARDLDELVSLVNHAETSVRAVERQRKKFIHITDSDLRERKKYVKARRQEVRKMKDERTSTQTKNKMQQDKQKKLFGKKNQGGGGGGGEEKKKTYSENNTEFYEQQRQEQDDHRKMQDEMMDGMGANVDALNTYAVAIGDELDDQKMLLGKMKNYFFENFCHIKC